LRAIGLVALVGISHLGFGVLSTLGFPGTSRNSERAPSQRERDGIKGRVRRLILSARRDFRGAKSDAIGVSSIDFDRPKRKEFQV
jgi:hypothetical protein